MVRKKFLKLDSISNLAYMMAVKLTFEKFISRRCGTKRSRRLSVRESQKRSAFPQTHTNMQIHAPTQTQTHAHTHTHTHTRTHTCGETQWPLYTHTHTRIHTHIHTHAHTKTHTRSEMLASPFCSRVAKQVHTYKKYKNIYRHTHTHTHTRGETRRRRLSVCESQKRSTYTRKQKETVFSFKKWDSRQIFLVTHYQKFKWNKKMRFGDCLILVYSESRSSWYKFVVQMMSLRSAGTDSLVVFFRFIKR